MAFTPLKSALRFTRSSWGPNRPPPSPVNVLKKNTSNRVKRVPVGILSESDVKVTQVKGWSGQVKVTKSVIAGNWAFDGARA